MLPAGMLTDLDWDADWLDFVQVTIASLRTGIRVLMLE